jgi:prepilin-type N-terminal cleavage/methylation domain-containing protein
MNDSSTIQNQIDGEKDGKGFTLIEILIAIVLIGILSAVAVVGISSLVSKGSTSACGASKDAATAASAVWFANNGNTYPTTFTQLTAAPAAFTPPTNAVVAAQTVTNGWVLTMSGGTATTAPTFVCS